MDWSLWGSSVLGIFQPRILEWIAIPFSRELPNSGIEPWSPANLFCTSYISRFFTYIRIASEPCHVRSVVVQILQENWKTACSSSPRKQWSWDEFFTSCKAVCQWLKCTRSWSVSILESTSLTALTKVAASSSPTNSNLKLCFRAFIVCLGPLVLRWSALVGPGLCWSLL